MADPRKFKKGDRVRMGGAGVGTVTRVCRHGEWLMVNWDDRSAGYPSRVWNPYQGVLIWEPEPGEVERMLEQ